MYLLDKWSRTKKAENVYSFSSLCKNVGGSNDIKVLSLTNLVRGSIEMTPGWEYPEHICSGNDNVRGGLSNINA